MEPSLEDQRARRICFRINEYHFILSNIYEGLVDKDFKTAQKDTQFLIMELRFILKSIEQDDF
jgi:hypothetical protein